MNDCRTCKYAGNNADDRCRGCWKDGVWRRWEAADLEGNTAKSFEAGWNIGYMKGLEDGKAIANPKWIPVTERLPKVEGVYMESTVNRRLVYYASDAVLICEEDGTMFVSWLMAKADDPEAEHDPRWMDEVGNIVDIEPVAWMPLPKPYKPKEVTP